MKLSFQSSQNRAEIFEQLFARSKQLLNWMRKKVEIIEAYVIKGAENQSMPYVTAGEIYYAQLGENIGSEIDKNRPVLIFQTDDRYIRMSNMAVIIPYKSMPLQQVKGNAQTVKIDAAKN